MQRRMLIGAAAVAALFAIAAKSIHLDGTACSHGV